MAPTWGQLGANLGAKMEEKSIKNEIESRLIFEKLAGSLNKDKSFISSLILVIVAFASLPILVTKGNTHFKHALEWNYFVGVITFYLLTFFFWRRTT